MRAIESKLLEVRRVPGDSPLLGRHRDETLRLLSDFAGAATGRSVAVASLRPDGPVVGLGLDEVRPGASTLKLALIAALLAAGPACGVDLTERVRAGDLPQSKWPSVLDALSADSTLSIADLCTLSVVSSDNATTQFLLDRLGKPAVAQWLSSIGCSGDAMLIAGYDDEAIEKRGRQNTLTLNDSIKILRVLVAEPVYQPLLLAMVNNVRNQRIPRFLDDDVWVAHKTGSLSGVVNDIGIVFAHGSAFILAVLTEGQPSPYGTEGEIARLAEKLVALAAQ